MKPTGECRPETPRTAVGQAPKGNACFCSIWRLRSRTYAGISEMVSHPLGDLYTAGEIEGGSGTELAGGRARQAWRPGLLTDCFLGRTPPSPGSHRSHASTKSNLLVPDVFHFQRTQDGQRWLLRTQKEQTAVLELAKVDPPFFTSQTSLSSLLPPIPHPPHTSRSLSAAGRGTRPEHVKGRQFGSVELKCAC